MITYQKLVQFAFKDKDLSLNKDPFFKLLTSDLNLTAYSFRKDNKFIDYGILVKTKQANLMIKTNNCLIRVYNLIREIIDGSCWTGNKEFSKLIKYNFNVNCWVTDNSVTIKLKNGVKVTLPWDALGDSFLEIYGKIHMTIDFLK